MTRYAQSERQALADLLLEVGPDEPTLCAGWTTRDLAAHLVVRDRQPLAAAAPRIPPLSGYAERVRLARAAEPYRKLVGEVRTPPWWSPVSNRLVESLTNTGEFFIHHEDVRRGRPGWEPRDLDPGLSATLWRSATLVGKLSLRKVGVPVRVRGEGHGEFTVGEAPRVTLTGPPGELALFLFGRQAATRVTLDGPEEQTRRLREAGLGV